jgi:hypothetical protein
MLGKACSNGPPLIFGPTHWATALKAMTLKLGEALESKPSPYIYLEGICEFPL